MEEVKNSAFPISTDSAPWPDGLNTFFYQTCWEVIAEDAYNLVLAFFKDLLSQYYFLTHVL